jgi:hypothetical protein
MLPHCRKCAMRWRKTALAALWTGRENTSLGRLDMDLRACSETTWSGSRNARASRMHISQRIAAAASIATALGVFFAGVQLLLQKRQATTQFEDDLAKQYRDILRELPLQAHFAESVGDDEYRAALRDLLSYVDLTNEQIFLRMKGRIRADTWRDWCDGIRDALRRPLFARAWEEIKRRSPESFQELRALENTGFVVDPRRWRRGLPPVRE